MNQPAAALTAPIDHYENFPVASILLPRALRNPVRVIYRFARTADDIADEGDLAPEARLAQLGAMRDELDAIAHKKRVSAPLSVAVAAIIEKHGLPIEEFYKLLDAFQQDVTKTRYANFGEVMTYCRSSANPVGRLMLRLFDQATPHNVGLSDAICSSLQIINFLQDIAIDFSRGRIYLPQDEMEQFGIDEGRLASGDTLGLWWPFMQKQILRARHLLESGAPLGKVLPGRFGLEIRMIIAGGDTILRKLYEARGDVFNARPVLTKRDWPAMMYKALRAR